MVFVYTLRIGNPNPLSLCAGVFFPSIHCMMKILIHLAYTLMFGFLLYSVQWKSKSTFPISWCILAFYTLCTGNPDTLCLYTDVCFSSLHNTALCLYAGVCLPSIHCAMEILIHFAYTLIYGFLLYIVQWKS